MIIKSFSKTSIVSAILLVISASSFASNHKEGNSEKAKNSASIKCHPAALTTEEKSPTSKTTNHFSVQCFVQNSAQNGGPISILYKGTMPVFGSTPYGVDANYHVQLVQDNLDLLALRKGAEITPGEGLGGVSQSVVPSVAALPTHFQQQMHWDSGTKALSIQAYPGIWHIMQLQESGHTSTLASGTAGLAPNESIVSAADTAQMSLISAGYANKALDQGKTLTKVTFDDSISRFSAAKHQAVVVQLVQGLRDGKVENLLGSTRAQNQELLRESLILLDRQPKDITRAWAVASVSQFLGQQGEKYYAIQKVAANNPHLLADFENDVAKIRAFELPVEQALSGK